MLPVRIRVVNLGRVEREYREIISFYETRISRLARFRRDYSGKISDGAVFLDSRGEKMDSDDFYELLGRFSSSGMEIVFVIGPPEGFSQIPENAKVLSLSPMTFRHELAYLILLEQIYRSLLRMKGTRYER